MKQSIYTLFALLLPLTLLLTIACREESSRSNSGDNNTQTNDAGQDHTPPPDDAAQDTIEDAPDDAAQDTIEDEISSPSDRFRCDDTILNTTSTEQHKWGSSYCNWDTPQMESVALEQSGRILQFAENSFHTHQFSIQGSSTGYIGLQTHSILPDESIERNVRFSIWDTIEALGPDCRPFGGEGVGHTCVINPFTLRPYAFYTLRVEKFSTEADGIWWQGSVTDEETGTQEVIGLIKTPLSNEEQYIHPFVNFSEYFGWKVTDCTFVPQSIVEWRAPLLKDSFGQTIEAPFLEFRLPNTGTGPCVPGNELGVIASGEIVTTDAETLYRMVNGSVQVCFPEE